MSGTNTSSTLLVTTENRIKTITFNQPKKKNAISNNMARNFLKVIEDTRTDDSRVIIITGAGDNFCAGADLDPSLLNGKPFDVATFLRTTYNPLVLAMREINKPFIAKVKGTCVGVGFNFALACDMVYAANDAKFSQIFTRIGLTTDGGGAYFMPERIGYHKAFELMATNKVFGAEEAQKLGLVNHVLPTDKLDQEVQAMAEALANGPYIAIQHTKANLRAAMTGGLTAALEQEAVSQGINFKTKDFFEGIMAFLQKRKPDYKGE